MREFAKLFVRYRRSKLQDEKGFAPEERHTALVRLTERRPMQRALLCSFLFGCGHAVCNSELVRSVMSGFSRNRHLSLLVIFHFSSTALS